MLEYNNLSYTPENDSNVHVTILKHFVYGWQMNITAEFYLPSKIYS